MSDYVDLHSHLLPGVDDGMTSLSECLKALKLYENIGFSTIICTPHQKQYSLNPSTDSLIEVFNAVCEENPTRIKLHLGAENYYDDQFLGRYFRRQIPTLGKSRFFLFELSPTIPVPGLERMLYEINITGFIPVLAHVERYGWLEKKDIKLFRDNVRICGNLTSVLKSQTPDDRHQKLIKLLKSGYIDFMTTDIHSTDLFPGIEKAVKWLTKNFGEDTTQRLLHSNPMEIINDIHQ